MNALTIKGLTKTYKGGFEALKGIDLTVAAGDFYALLGPNGAGKSTTIGIISSLVNKTQGEVEVFGFNLDTHLVQAKQHIGLVPQEFNFNQFETVLEVVLIQAGYYGVPRSEALKRAQRYLTQLELWDKRNEKSRELSGGMKRRLMIARALMHHPKLLILDEPTAGVDIELRRSMWDFLRQLNNDGVTIILTTHYLEEAEMLCRNIGIIDHGKMVQNTSMKSLLAKLNVETLVLEIIATDKSFELSGFSHRTIDDHTVEVDVKRGNSINLLFAQLSEQGIEVISMRNKANRLEELFIGLVNQSR
jgi:ABC-2 type transport system ATP-binding protein